jgi:cell division protein FtsI/penicillin-binding protein 2
MSHIQVPDDDFGLAEIASGFNKRTLISPLHAVLITSAVANSGKIMEPWIVKKISNESGKILYRAKSSPLTNPIKDSTAKNLRILMEDTVRYGTCRKAFFSMRRKKVFKNIKMGAKTGTINDPLDQYKYDWLTAYTLPNNGDGGICVAVLAIHGKKLGIRAKDLARYIINHHYTS